MTERLKILLLTPQTPYPPDQGAAIRNFNFVRYLGSDPRCELTLLSFARPGENPATTPARAVLEKYCRQVVLVPPPPARSKLVRLLGLLTGQTDLLQRLASVHFAQALDDLSDEYDAVQCEGLELAPFVLDWIEAKHTISQGSPRLILDEHNAEYLLQRRIFENDWQAGWGRRPVALYSWLQARRLLRYEKKALNVFNRVIAVSDPDRQALSGLIWPERKVLARRMSEQHQPITVIPNCIDLEEFVPPPDRQAEQPDQLVFTGTMDFRPNVDAVTWFAREVWPLVRQAKPQARFVIVGRRPAPAVANLKLVPGIEVTGTVADARPYIRQSALYVVPIRMGGGVRYKVLEALAMGKAVVSTTFGADGIDLTPGQEALLADSPVDFARAILELLDDPLRRATLATYGRAFVEANFDWRKMLPRLDQVLNLDHQS